MPTTPELLCGVPSCTRPAGGGEAGLVKMCEVHYTIFEAEGALEDWQEAKRLLLPWVDAARVVGHHKLLVAMDESLERVEQEIERAREELEEARAAL